MAIEINTFFPAGNTVVIAATTTSSTASIPLGAAMGGISVRVYNDGPNLAFISIGKGAATASAVSIPLPSGAVEMLLKGANDTFAAVTLSGTANVYFTPGGGN